MAELQIRRLRRMRNWTQQHVADRIGRTKVFVHELETGKTKPSYPILCKLEDLFGKSHRYLFAEVSDDEESSPL